MAKTLPLARGFARPTIRTAALALIALLVFPLQEVAAYSNSPTSIGGLTRKSGSEAGCSGCHNARDTSIAVSITGPGSPPYSLAAGQSATFTITASKTNLANGAYMGVAVAATDASSLTVFAGEPTTNYNGEIIHTGGLGAIRTTTGGTGSANYKVTFAMPAVATAGSFKTIYALAALGAPRAPWNHATNVIVYVPPSAPSSVSASGITTASVNLSWSGGGTEYRVVYKTGASPPSNTADGTALVDTTSTSVTVSGLTQGTQYSFAVFSKLSGVAVFSSTAASTTATTTAAVVGARFVNAATGVNTGDCRTQGSPCKTITYAMSQAATGSPGDPINVAAGTYNAALGEVFPIVITSGVQLLAGGTAANTIIDATGANARVFNAIGSNASTVLQGFTITGGLHQPAPNANAEAGALFINTLSEIKVRRNAFVGNTARGYNGVAPSSPSGGIAYGGAIVSYNSSPTIENNVFRANTARGGDGVDKFDGSAGGDGGSAHGGALFIGGGTAAFLVNNTFYGNSVIGGEGGSSNASFGGAGGPSFNGGAETNNTTAANNIFASNSSSGGAGGGGSPAGAAGSGLNGALNNSGPTTTHNLFFGNTAAIAGDTLGTNSLSADPLFHSAPTNLRILPASPANGSGTVTSAPATDFDGTARLTPPARGAFEASKFASSTAVVSGTNPSSNGQSVTFTATVSGSSGTPTGTVTFKNGATTVCATVALVSAQAQCATSTLTVGTHSITGEYSGNATYAASTSTAVSQVVNQATFTLTVVKAGTGAGTVTSSPAGISCGATCAASFNTGSAVTLTASASAGSGFTGWSGGGCGGTGGCTVTMSSAVSVTATFTAAAASTTTLASGTNPSTSGQSVTFTASVSGGSGVATGTVTFKNGSTTVCGAVPLASGQAQCATAALTVGTHSMTAEYSGNGTYAASTSAALNQVVQAPTAPVTFNVTISGSQEVPPNAIAASGSGTATVNTTANTITYSFTVSGLSGALVATHFHGPAPRGVDAGVKLDIGSSPFSGTVNYNEADEADILNGRWYVNFHTAAFPGGEVRGQLDNLGGSTAVTLAVTKTGTGAGTVTSSPAGIDCGATCSANFGSGASVTLAAAPASDSLFMGWSGGGCSGTGSCTVSVSAATTVTALFQAVSGTLRTRYRLYSPGTFEHLYTTDFNEYSVLPVCCAWVAEGAIYRVFGGAGSFGGVASVPYYRLYNPFSYQHHWTTDANEYNFLPSVGWVQEGIDGQILPTQATGTLPLYRLYLNAAGGLHLWTIDANERNYLIANAGWVDEGIAGYVIPLP